MEPIASLMSAHFADYVLKSSLATTSVDIKSRAVRYLTRLCGDIDPAKITYTDAEDYINWLKKGRSPNAVNTYLANIKPFFNWLIRHNKIKESPFSFIKFLPENNQIKPVYTGDELYRLIRVANLRWKVVILLAVCSSLRRSEILNLTVRDIYLDKSSILVEPKKDAANTWAWTVKNHQAAFVPFPEIVRLPEMEINFHKLIIDLMDTLPANQPYLCLSPLQYRRRIEALHQGKLDYYHRLQPWQSFSRDFRLLSGRAMIKTKSLRDLRATFATTLANNNFSLVATQNLMRHKSPATTAKYYIRFDKQKLIDEAVEIQKSCFV